MKNYYPLIIVSVVALAIFILVWFRVFTKITKPMVGLYALTIISLAIIWENTFFSNNEINSIYLMVNLIAWIVCIVYSVVLMLGAAMKEPVFKKLGATITIIALAIIIGTTFL